MLVIVLVLLLIGITLRIGVYAVYSDKDITTIENSKFVSQDPLQKIENNLSTKVTEEQALNLAIQYKNLLSKGSETENLSYVIMLIMVWKN